MITSVIVLNYNDWQLTGKYVMHISKYSCIDHIVVVDNSSTDGSFNHLQKLTSSKIDVIKTSANEGYASGNNEGIRFIVQKYGECGIVIISNPDIKISSNSFEAIVNSFNNRPNQFAATGEVYNLKGNRIPLFTWKLPSYGMLLIQNSAVLRVIFKKAFGYGKQYSCLESIEHDDSYYGEVLPGCFFAVDLSKMIQIGLFSESTFLYYEEEILFFKAKKEGYLSRVIKGANLIHEEGTTTKKTIRSWRKRESYFEDSCIVYMKECLNIRGFRLNLHKFLNWLFLPERYICEQIKKSRDKI